MHLLILLNSSEVQVVVMLVVNYLSRYHWLGLFLELETLQLPVLYCL